MSTKDSARLTMDSCVGREREDQAVKRLFSRKDFLANIMKGTIAEYADLSIEEIMDCIEGDTIQTGTASWQNDPSRCFPLQMRSHHPYKNNYSRHQYPAWIFVQD